MPVRAVPPMSFRSGYRRRGVGDLATVASTIQLVEGWFPGSLSYRNNNPGNLRPAGQPGCTATSDNFCSFPDYSTGYQALLHQIQLDAGRGLSIAQFTNKYAPASDANNPTSYAATIAAASGLSVNDPLSLALANTGQAPGGIPLPPALQPDAPPPDASSTDFTYADMTGGAVLPDSTGLWIAGGLAAAILLVVFLG